MKLINSALRSELMFGDKNGFLCVYVGRISNEKRMDVIMEAVRKLDGKRTAYLAIIGECVDVYVYCACRNNLTFSAESLEQNDRVAGCIFVMLCCSYYCRSIEKLYTEVYLNAAITRHQP
jgi:hypothetical protein